MSTALRTRTSLHLPITLSVVLMALNIVLMICWIVMLAHSTGWGALITGTITFAVILVGLTFYLILIIKEVRLNQRQANFVDSVTHELKSPIASLKLYLETLEMRPVSEEQRNGFYRVMGQELRRLDHLISQLLEVGRLDAIGTQSEPQEILVEELLRDSANSVCATHQRDPATTVTFEIQPCVIRARLLVVETIVRNVLDNAVKYGDEPPKVHIQARLKDRGQVVIAVSDNGPGVPVENRKRIFGMFFRGGSELTRTKKGTGLGLYIVQTLVRQLKGRISVHDRGAERGSVFEIVLPGGTACES